MSFWVYKCNARPHHYHRLVGDWNEVFSKATPGRWGSTESVPEFRHLKKGDLLIACQSDRNELVGLAEVVGIRKRSDFADIIVMPVEEIRVKIRQLKSMDDKVAALKAFAQGNIKTIYPISTANAWHLLSIAKAQAQIEKAIRLGGTPKK